MPWAETAYEFAAWMRDRFVLCGPRERKEGRNSTQTVNAPPSTSKDTTSKITFNLPALDLNVDALAPNASNGQEVPNLVDFVTSSNEGIYLLKELTGKYIHDLFYEKIIKSPMNFGTLR